MGVLDSVAFVKKKSLLPYSRVIRAGTVLESPLTKLRTSSRNFPFH